MIPFLVPWEGMRQMGFHGGRRALVWMVHQDVVAATVATASIIITIIGSYY
jgi:hypothetical protein